MASFKSLSPHDNLVVQTCSVITAVRKTLNSTDIQCTHAIEHLRDIETLLCHLVADMIASPMTGRLHLPHPAAYVEDAHRQASLERQLSISP